MSDAPAESAPAKANVGGSNKIVIGLAAGAMILSLANTILLATNPTAKKVEQFNEELKTDLADSIASVHKKIDGLKSAELEWQNVLKKASEKPNAVYKVVNNKDGYLTLTEIDPGAAEAPAEAPAEKKH
ncbi:hypothetical protein [Azonexus sp. IMCC34839]|uniref:hypothetical protein n=1 Tax=Azonexus sp. IMCC34839 TaxID=3133695 RepID=UPI00399BCF0C